MTTTVKILRSDRPLLNTKLAEAELNFVGGDQTA